jgi:hypothetical protein
VTQLLDQLDDPTHTVLQVGRREISGHQLLDLADWLSVVGEDVIERPVPSPDVDLAKARGSWIWDFYSEARLQEFYGAVLGLACTAYDELAHTVFAKFGWSLGTLADGEFGVIADLSYTSGSRGDHTPVLSSAKVPIALFREAELEFGSAGLVAPNGRALVTHSPSSSHIDSWIRQFVSDHANATLEARSPNPFSRFGSYSSAIADDMNSSRPASSFAAKWVFDDFKSFGLADGTFPQLED